MANAKRILSLFAFFIPSLGLFDILYHWHAEQFPFQLRAYGFIKGPNDTLELYNMTEEVLWSDIDRWDYDNSIPPGYTLYTGLTLGQTFLSFISQVRNHEYQCFPEYKFCYLTRKD